MENEYYLPIDTVNLAHYFQIACICPSKYIKNRNKDVQDQFENSLLLSNQRFIGNNNCSLLIVINDVEANDITKISENYCYYNKPLPISRVKKIIFRDEEHKNITVFNVNSGAAFIPNNLIDVDTATGAFFEEPGQYLDKVTKDDQDWSQEIEKFDRVLGGLSLLAISGIDHHNIPKIYFDSLSLFNTNIKNELQEQSINITNRYEKLLFDIREKKGLKKFIYSKIRHEDVVRSNNNSELDMRTGMYMLDKIDNKDAYYLALLATYGEGNRKSLDDFMSNLISNKFPQQRKEFIAIICGINKGYSAFRNRYRLQNTNIDVKYKLDSRLDYYAIESIYQNVFNGKTDNTKYDYLDNWCPSYPVNHEHTSFMQYRTYKLLDREFNGEPFSLKDLLQNAKTYIKNIITRFIEEIIQVFEIIINTQEKNSSALKAENLAKDKELTTLTQRQQDLQRDYEAVQADKSAVEKKAGELENANRAKDEELTTLTQRQEDLQRDYEAAQADKTTLVQKAGVLNAENQAKKEEMTALQQQLEGLERVSQVVRHEKIAAEQKADELNAQNQAKEEKLTTLQQQNEELQRDYQVVQAEKSDIEMNFSELIASIQSEETTEQTDDVSNVIDVDDSSDLFSSDELTDNENRRVALNRYKKTELVKLAKKNGVKRISRLNKDDLVNAILKIRIIK